MRRVVIDTNVAVSAFLTHHGNAAKILDMITSRQLKVCYSNEILAEYIEVLSRPRFGFSIADQEGFINGIRCFGILVEPLKSSLPFADESDQIFYDTAQFCGALLITGNLKHYPNEPLIVTPAEFLTLLS
jgi:putative PIN family toxin of toxin-antitoxin system